MDNKIAVVAFGGNALHPEDQVGTIEEQETNASEASKAIIEIARNGYELVLVHGNGPQVGNMLIQVERAVDEVPPLPLYTCVASTQGSIGFMLTNSMRKECEKLGLNKEIVTLMTTVVVDEDDPAFQTPTKPIGPFFNEEYAQRMTQEKNWQVVEDSGRGYRRVVPSPVPSDILEKKVIQQMVKNHNIVIACGGGGIPVMFKDNEIKGVEAVIDKDYASSLLANEIGADLYIILTGVPQVAINFGQPNMQHLDTITVSEAKKHMAEGQFPPGSMGPKIEAAIRYIEAGGKEVLVTSASELDKALKRESGTYIVR
ncbi:Carbamate kinase [Candidatus Syntrophocurvum alkaliphilum]|uniref:Carbamate kinase n=1 Tax=Candidatus Syntrophocurvum alkaliphilum TaxID=2293317 RepID=A0A6I6DD66_9FIRM|nr:carbamate kinase [Candidatus Syntrophocurvum alkaliphilum]QGT98782.1 Carbamate kinase [Candidatus Syntrophocurvum alkaliphilum]